MTKRNTFELSLYTNPLSMGSSSNAHYGGNAKTYMNVGLGMGKAMVELLQNEQIHKGDK
jgi:hypothetical protein